MRIGADGERSFSFDIDIGGNDFWYFQVTNLTEEVSESMIITFKPSTSSSGSESLLIYILLAVACSIILLWIVLAILKSRVRRV
jgi:uncharacterized membrane protein YhaH (DUF805 family)